MLVYRKVSCMWTLDLWKKKLNWGPVTPFQDLTPADLKLCFEMSHQIEQRRSSIGQTSQLTNQLPLAPLGTENVLGDGTSRHTTWNKKHHVFLRCSKYRNGTSMMSSLHLGLAGSQKRPRKRTTSDVTCQFHGQKYVRVSSKFCLLGSETTEFRRKFIALAIVCHEIVVRETKDWKGDPQISKPPILTRPSHHARPPFGEPRRFTPQNETHCSTVLSPKIDPSTFQGGKTHQRNAGV